MSPKQAQRLNDGWIQPLEFPALQWLAARMPSALTPNRLTAIGTFGSLITLFGYAAVPWSLHGLWLASLGLIINWFGDSLDGTVARYRKIERQRFGFFLDNAIDVLQHFIITVGIGLSGLIRWDLCFISLSVFFMMEILSLLRMQVSGFFTITHGGIGLTEMRLIGIVLNTLIFVYPPDRLDWLNLPLSYPNLLYLAWILGTLTAFCISLARQIREVSIEDPLK